MAISELTEVIDRIPREDAQSATHHILHRAQAAHLYRRCWRKRG